MSVNISDFNKKTSVKVHQLTCVKCSFYHKTNNPSQIQRWICEIIGGVCKIGLLNSETPARRTNSGGGGGDGIVKTLHWV